MLETRRIFNIATRKGIGQTRCSVEIKCGGLSRQLNSYGSHLSDPSCQDLFCFQTRSGKTFTPLQSAQPLPSALQPRSLGCSASGILSSSALESHRAGFRVTHASAGTRCAVQHPCLTAFRHQPLKPEPCSLRPVGHTWGSSQQHSSLAKVLPRKSHFTALWL